MKSYSVMNAVAAMVILLASGCDFEEKLSLRKLEEDIMKQEPVVKDVEPTETLKQSQTKKGCASLEHFIATRIKMLESSRVENETDMASINADRQKLSQRIGEIADKNFENTNGTRATALLMFLRDADVNALAIKYLDGDFVMIRSEFEEKVRHAAAMERQKNEALAQNKAMYDSAEENAKLTLNQTRKSIEVREAQRKRDIASVERRLKNLRISKELGERREETRKREQEISRLEGELAALKDAGKFQNQMAQAQKADQIAETSKQKAMQEKARADKDILTRHKDDVTAFQLAEEYEKKTVIRLNEVMKEVDLAARAKKKLLMKQIAFLSSLSEGLDKLDMAGLKKVREEIDKELGTAEEGVAQQ